METIDIKAFRKANNISQKQLANYLNVTQGLVSQWEAGKYKVPMSCIDQLIKNKEGWNMTPLLGKQIAEYRAFLSKALIGEEQTEKKKIPLYDDVASIGGTNDQVANVDDSARPTEWIDAGDWFPTATSAIHHYGDSMTEYPSGCILALKRVNDSRLLLNGENYVIETDEFRITKRILDDGEDIIAYSTNQETYPDGRLVHAPIRIPKNAIRHLDLVLGCVIRKFSTPVKIR